MEGPGGTPATGSSMPGGTREASVPLPADKRELYFAGADKFRDLLARIRAARRTST